MQDDDNEIQGVKLEVFNDAQDLAKTFESLTKKGLKKVENLKKKHSKKVMEKVGDGNDYHETRETYENK